MTLRPDRGAAWTVGLVLDWDLREGCDEVGEASPASAFIMVEADFLFQILKVALNAPSP
jgi:hypothetical protein